MSPSDMQKFLKEVNLTKEQFIVKIADFGMLKKFHFKRDYAKTSVSSPLYITPEVLTVKK